MNIQNNFWNTDGFRSSDNSFNSPLCGKVAAFVGGLVLLTLLAITSQAAYADAKIGGFVKFDGSHTRYGNGIPAANQGLKDSINIMSIPTGNTGNKTTDVHFSSKVSRLNIGGDFKSAKYFAEMDFLSSGQGTEKVSNSYSPRLRHFYVKNDMFLAGQTWSTFASPWSYPETLYFGGGSPARIFDRQSQVRYTYMMGENSFNLALENPASYVIANGGAAGVQSSAEHAPSVVAKYNHSMMNGSMFSLAGIHRLITWKNGANSENKSTFAMSAAAKIKFMDKDDIRLGLNVGPGLGRYMVSFDDAVLDANGKLHTFSQRGFTAGLRHFWSDSLRSNIAYSAARSSRHANIANTYQKTLTAAHVNVIRKFDNIDVGVEYSFGKRKNHDNTKGDLSRVQLSVKYAFSEEV